MRPDAPPTPEEIARAFVLQQAQADSEPGTPQEGAKLADKIYQDYLATVEPNTEGPGLLAFIGNLAGEHSVTNPDRGPDRSFWSYVSDLEGTDKPVPNRFLAKACGESRNLQVLEDTPAGHQLNSYCLGNDNVVTALSSHFDFDEAELDAVHGDAWDTLSKRYAQETEGMAVGFAADITKGSVLGRIEVPELLANSNVGKEGIKFATPLPVNPNLPAEMNTFLANDPVRCQLRLEDCNDPEQSPEEFAMKLHAMDIPEDQKEAHGKIVDRLSMANSYKELKPTAPEAKQSGRMSEFIPGLNVSHGVVPARRSVITGHGVSEPAPPQIAPKATGIEH
uniref:Uncharacterized protein n=1 Tax=Streptomyces sp. NBC_00049 TaxID=2903617 RepID=A0AAU2JQW5_9ACTN